MADRTTFRLVPTACIAVALCLCGCKSLTNKKFAPLPFTEDAPSSAAVLDSQLSLGRLTERRGDFDRAKTIYRKVLDAAPTNVEALHRIGVILAQEGAIDESLASLQLANTTPSGAVLADIGYAYYLKGDLVKAEQALRNSLQHDPKNKRAMNNLALVVGQQGDYDESLAIFRRSNRPAMAHANLAYVMTQKGDLEGAADSYHRALDYDRDLKLAAQALIQLQDHLPNDSPLPIGDGFARSNPTLLASFARETSKSQDIAKRIPAATHLADPSFNPRSDLVSNPPDATVPSLTPTTKTPVASGPSPSQLSADRDPVDRDPAESYTDKNHTTGPPATKQYVSNRQPIAKMPIAKMPIAKMPALAIPKISFPGLAAKPAPAKTTAPSTVNLDEKNRIDASATNRWKQFTTQTSEAKKVPTKPPTLDRIAKRTPTRSTPQVTEPTKQVEPATQAGPYTQVGPYTAIETGPDSATSETQFTLPDPPRDPKSDASPPSRENDGSLVQQGLYSAT